MFGGPLRAEPGHDADAPIAVIKCYRGFSIAISKRSLMSISLRLATEAEKPQLRLMLSVYLEELSQYGDVNLEYPFLDSYWTDEDRWPYIIEKDGIAAGFALLHTWSQSKRGTDFAVAEFYVLPQFRGSGVGQRAYVSLLDRHPGTWELSVMMRNEAAKEFWGRTITAADVTKIEQFELEDELIYRFTTKV
jgi:predicted acetyltransferase